MRKLITAAAIAVAAVVTFAPAAHAECEGIKCYLEPGECTDPYTCLICIDEVILGYHIEICQLRPE